MSRQTSIEGRRIAAVTYTQKYVLYISSLYTYEYSSQLTYMFNNKNNLPIQAKLPVVGEP